MISRELSQKYEIIHRTEKNIKDKMISLEESGQEISLIRYTLKQLKQDNEVLWKRHNLDKHVENNLKIQKEISYMSIQDVIKNLQTVGQTFGEQKAYNEKFQQKLQEERIKIVENHQQQEKLEKLRINHLEKNKQLQNLQQKVAKVKEYKETILKQEKLILKLQSVMEQCVSYKQKTFDYHHEYQILKEQVELMKINLKTLAYQGEEGILEKWVHKCQKLQHIADTLEIELKKAKRVDSQVLTNEEMDLVNLQTKLYDVNMRYEMIQEEIKKNAKEFQYKQQEIRYDIALKNTQIDATKIY